MAVIGLRAAAARVRPRHAQVSDWQEAVEGNQPTSAKFEEEILLGELFRGLDEDRREAFVLTQTLGLSYSEAADVCDCPVGTIRSRVARARDDLITAMSETDRPRRRSAI